jgi:CBS domain-containing protein
MKCPMCGFENLPGADECEQCGEDLGDLDVLAAAAPIGVLATPIGQVPSPPAVIVDPAATVREVVDRLISAGASCVLVVSRGRLIGIFSERDLLMRVADRYDALRSSPIREFMTPDPETLGPEATVAWALNRMDVGGFRHLPLLEEGRPLRVVSVKHLLAFLADSYPKAA